MCYRVLISMVLRMGVVIETTVLTVSAAIYSPMVARFSLATAATV
jgi:hypothetical protein